MLFHGTSRCGVIGILNRGFKNSKDGWFGSAVYITDCSYNVQRYTMRNTHEYNFIFVNEVLESEKLQTFEFDIFGIKQNGNPLKNTFNKHIRNFNGKKSAQTAEEYYKRDVKGRKYRNIVVDKYSTTDEYVAEASVTIPKCLILSKTPKKRKRFNINMIFFGICKASTAM